MGLRGFQFAPHLSKAAIGYEHEVKDFVLSAAYDIADDKAFVGASKVRPDSKT